MCKCVFLTILMLLHLILLPFASVSTEIRLANLEIWTVISRFSLTVFYGIVRPPFNMYAGEYCPFDQLKTSSAPHVTSLCPRNPICVRFLSDLTQSSCTKQQNHPRAKVPRSPVAPLVPPPPHPCPPHPPDINALFHQNGWNPPDYYGFIYKRLHHSTCNLSDGCESFLFFLTPWLLWRRRQTEKEEKLVCPVDVEERFLADARCVGTLVTSEAASHPTAGAQTDLAGSGFSFPQNYCVDSAFLPKFD